MVTHSLTDRPMTIDDLATLPEDRNRYELIGGELIESPASSSRHQYVTGELTWLLVGHVVQQGLGLVYSAPFDVKLSTHHDLVQPDLVVVLNERRDRITEAGLEGAPDLVVEILSPSTRGTDRLKKAALYATHGVREYWVVDPDAEGISIQVMRDGRFVPLGTEDGAVTSEVLPELDVELRSIFPVSS